MLVYFDASVVVSLVIQDAHSDRADALSARLAAQAVPRTASDWTLTESASVVAARVRNRQLTLESAKARFAHVRRAIVSGEPAALTDTDHDFAWDLLSRMDQSLRTPDALHLAVARRLGAALATFDETMADAARTLDIQVMDA